MVYSKITITYQIKSINRFFILEQMPTRTPISGGESNLLSPINHIRFWEKGEMAYSALKKINELKANNELIKAEVILAEWIL